MGFAFSVGNSGFGGGHLRKTLLKHFGVPAGDVATTGRQFPIVARVDIQAAIEDLVRSRAGTRLLGFVSPNPHEPPSLAQALGQNPFGLDSGPLQHDEIDIGETTPARCLKHGLWLSRERDLPFAILMAPGGRFGLCTGVQVEIATPAGEHGAQFSQELFRQLEIQVSQSRTHRGRVISLEGQIDPMGGGSAIKVHRLAKVNRDEHPASQNLGHARPQRGRIHQGAGPAQNAALSGAERAFVLWTARHGQNLYHSLSRLATTKPYDLGW